jgi:hypothetical protein
MNHRGRGGCAPGRRWRADGGRRGGCGGDTGVRARVGGFAYAFSAVYVCWSESV